MYIYIVGEDLLEIVNFSKHINFLQFFVFEKQIHMHFVILILITKQKNKTKIKLIGKNKSSIPVNSERALMFLEH